MPFTSLLVEQLETELIRVSDIRWGYRLHEGVHTQYGIVTFVMFCTYLYMWRIAL